MKNTISVVVNGDFVTVTRVREIMPHEKPGLDTKTHFRETTVMDFTAERVVGTTEYSYTGKETTR